MKTFEYKLQGNGVDSWVMTDTITGHKEMLYISPIDLYKKEVNDYHNAMLKQVLNDHDYINIGEVSLWLGTEFNDEAQSIINWWKATSMQVLNHFSEISEYIEPADFCQTILPYQINE
jgi:hypothetical protein